jgi:hypothetical protein
MMRRDRIACLTAAWTAAAAVSAAADASAAPILEFRFNDVANGSTSVSTGTSNAAVQFLEGSAASPTPVANPRAMNGPSGLPGDYSFDNSVTVGTTGRIAVNTTFTGLSGATAWTISGWYYLTYPGTTTPTGGVVLAQAPGYFGNPPPQSMPTNLINVYGITDGGVGREGFAVRWGNGNELRTSTSGVNTPAGSSLSPTLLSWATIGSWVFFGVSYDVPSQTLRYYQGRVGSAVSLIATETFTTPIDNPGDPRVRAVGPTGGGGLTTGFSIGNRLEDFGRAFDGYLDNIRFDASFGDSSGALTLAQLEAYRQADLNPFPVPEPAGAVPLFGAAAAAVAGVRLWMRRRSAR